jgi:cytochrome c556
MREKSLIILSSIVLVLVVSASIFAQTVLKKGQNSPSQIVAARKFAMRMLGANVGDLSGKIKAGNMKGVAVNAGSIASLATFFPLVYKETYADVYPVSGSKYYYKGGLPDVGAAFENLRGEAQALMKLSKSKDKSAIEAQRGKMLGACGACHKVARGQY